MPAFTGADWIVVIGAVGAALATVAGGWLGHRRAAKGEPPEPAVQLHHEDRTLLLKVIDQIARGVTRIETALSEHRRALDDNSDHLKRNRKD